MENAVHIRHNTYIHPCNISECRTNGKDVPRMNEKGEKRRETVLELKDVSRTFRMGEVEVHALRDVSISVKAGDLTVIQGPSGCGKTTLLNQIGGIDSPSKGTILVKGEDISGYDQAMLTTYRREHVGFVFQFFNLIPNLTARENVEFVMEYVMDRSPSEARSRADTLLEKVGLGGRERHYPYQLSGGEQQRVSIARALAKDPDILLADEPTGELDYMTGKKILKLLSNLTREGKAVLMVTHNKELARIAHRVFHLRDGKVIRTEINDSPMDVEDLEW